MANCKSYRNESTANQAANANPTELLQPAQTGAHLVSYCSKAELEPTSLFLQAAGFELRSIYPADDPRIALLHHPKYSVSIRLTTSAHQGLGNTVALLSDDPRADAAQAGAPSGTVCLRAPNGLQLDFEPLNPPMTLPVPQPALCISNSSQSSSWVTGRAGMVS